MFNTVVTVAATAVSAELCGLVSELEAGKLLFFPHLPFDLDGDEKRLLRPDVRAPKSRNISLRPDGVLAGAAVQGHEAARLAGMVRRFASHASALIDAIAPSYRPQLRAAPTSFRPTRVESRQQSWRADDRRLHVDAFPSRPNRGERILRVFTNVNPHDEPRVWRVGEPFDAIARQFVPRAKRYAPWQAHALQTLGVTKSLRSEYDHLMLQLHDGMKRDTAYQRDCAQIAHAFPPGSTWVCFSDQTAHAAVSGQYMLEQTLHLPVQHQLNPQASPLAILERQLGRRLT